MPDRPTPFEVTLSNRTLVRLLVVGTAFFLLVLLLWNVRNVLQLLLVSMFLALALNPAVTWFELRGLRRGRAVAIVFLITIVTVLAILIIVFAPLYEEVRKFADDVPGYIDDLRRSRLLRELDARYDIFTKLQEQATKLPERLPGTASAFLGFAGAIFTALVNTFTVVFLTIFLLLELPVDRQLDPGAARARHRHPHPLADGRRERHRRALRGRQPRHLGDRRGDDDDRGVPARACRSRS